MSKKILLKSTITGLLAATVAANGYQLSSLAVTRDEVAKDGEYVSTSSYNVINSSPEDFEWSNYDVKVNVSVENGVFKSFDIITGDTYLADDNASYLKMATTGKKGISTKLIGQTASEATINSWDTVSGATIVSSAIKEAAINAINTAAVKEENVEANGEYVYGTVNLSYADFYYGELNDVEENKEIMLSENDKVTAKGYRDDGMYDAVSSATSNKSKRFSTTYYTEKETGVDIEGIANVNVAIPTELYNAAKVAIENEEQCNNSLLNIVKNIELFEDQSVTPIEYKVLNGDGTLTKMVTEVKVDTDATATITTDTRWGNYLVCLYKNEEGYNPLTTDEMLGLVIETTDGCKYGMGHLENLWLQTYEFSWAVEEFTEPHGNVVDYKRTEDIQGKTISKITYLVKDGADIVINTNLYVQKLLSDSDEITAEPDNGKYENNAKITVKYNVPADANYSVSEVKFNNEVLTIGTDYVIENNKIVINKTENTGVGKYSVTFTSAIYENITKEFILNSEYINEEGKIENNKVVLPEGINISDFIKNISSVTINEKNVMNAGSVLLDETGKVNLDAATQGRGATVLFPEDGEYDLIIEAYGYPTVSGKVVKPFEETNSEEDDNTSDDNTSDDNTSDDNGTSDDDSNTTDDNTSDNNGTSDDENNTTNDNGTLVDNNTTEDNNSGNSITADNKATTSKLTTSENSKETTVNDKTTVTENNSSVKTGDNNNIWGLLSIMIAILGAALLSIKGKLYKVNL